MLGLIAQLIVRLVLFLAAVYVTPFIVYAISPAAGGLLVILWVIEAIIALFVGW